MAFTSGNVKSMNEFIDAMTVYAIAQGWTQLAGSENQSDSGVFPLNSRYYKIGFSQSASGEPKIAELDIRATASGADLSLTASQLTLSGFTVGNGATELVDNVASTYWEPSTATDFFVEVDFGADQLFRELVITAPLGSGTDAPEDVFIYRSEDGRNWDLVHTFSALTFSAGEAKVLTLPVDTTNFASSTATGGVRRSCEYWLRGPGYDVDRRVYVGFYLFQDFVGGNQGFRMNASTAFDSAFDFDNQLQGCPPAQQPGLVIDNTTEDIDYWLYVNSTRIFAVLRAGAGDYAHFYSGFLSAFADPDQHNNPLYISGSSPNIGTAVDPDYLAWDEADSYNSTPWDPGDNGGGMHLDYQGNWVEVKNNDAGTSIGRKPLKYSDVFVYPFHLGTAEDNVSPTYSPSGRNDFINGSHFLKNIVVTEQDELPVFDVLVQSLTYGNIGKLSGVIAVPGAAVLTPEQVITLSAQNYRVFPKRTLRDDAQWIAVEEI